MTIDEGDLSTKAKTASKFFKEGNKVKVSLRLRGRQMAYISEGVTVTLKFAESLKEYAVVEKSPVAEGRFITMIMAPIPVKTATATKPKNLTGGGNNNA